MVFSQGRKETILKEKKDCWRKLGRVASQRMDRSKICKKLQNCP